jgi:hypothetical protein
MKELSMVHHKQNQVNKFDIQIYVQFRCFLEEKSKDQEGFFKKLKRAIFD